MIRSFALATSALVLAGAASAAMPAFEQVDSNADNLVSLGELLYFVDDADIASFTAHDANANAFLERREFESLKQDLAGA